MNPVTMVMFVVCLIGILLMPPSSDAVMNRPKICQTKDLVKAVGRVCRWSVGEEEETVARDADDVRGSSRSKRSAQTDARTAAGASFRETRLKLGASFFDGWRDEDLRLTMFKQVEDVLRAAAEEGAGKTGDRRRRSIRRKGGVYQSLLRRCCLQGCNDRDIERGLCH